MRRFWKATSVNLKAETIPNKLAASYFQKQVICDEISLKFKFEIKIFLLKEFVTKQKR